ncbi:MAG: serine/threonine-protein phosphatase [Bacteroidales bacterium]|nr:serine/threonine-protein phosphatase [Bacteroidales bacterium]
MHSLRAGNLIAFAIFIALTLVASRVAHVVSNKALLLGTIDLNTGEMEYCNAGHTKTLLNGDFLPQLSNFVLGGFPGFEYKSQKLTLAPGSRLVFYTDGVTEARNHDKAFFGEDSLLEWASHDYGDARQTCGSLLDKVCIFRGKARQNDDIAIMTIRLITT